MIGRSAIFVLHYEADKKHYAAGASSGSFRA